MPSDGAIQSHHVKEAGLEQEPTNTPTLPTSPVRTTIPLSAITGPPIYPRQGHPTKSSSTGGSQSPIHSSSGSSSPGTGGHLHKQPKPPNVFSNDGSFLARFQRLKREEGEKRKEKELLERKKQFADRFKNRGKRDHSEISESSSFGGTSGSASASDDVLSPESHASKSKKAKLDEGAASSSSSLESKPLTEYQKEMQNINTESLKGGGIGVRPLTK